MKISRHLVAAAFLIGATLTFAPPSSALPVATFEEGISFCGGTPTVGFSDLLPESISADFTTVDGRQCVGVVSTRFEPLDASMYTVDVQISSNFAPIVAAGRIRYSMGPVLINPAAPTDIPIPVLFTILGSASATGFGSATVQVLGVTEVGVFATACGADHASLPAGCSFGPEASLNVTGVLQLLPGEFISVLKEAVARSLQGEEGEGQAVIDPQFTIDPDFRIDFNNVSTLATDLYTLAYSNVITPGPVAAAEPASLALFGLALGVLGLSRRRRPVTSLSAR